LHLVKVINLFEMGKDKLTVGDVAELLGVITHTTGHFQKSAEKARYWV